MDIINEEYYWKNEKDKIVINDYIMSINDYVKEIHENAKEKGWYDKPRTPLEIHALIHSEISEAVEEVRKDTKPFYIENGKPEGEAIELVDAVIRIMDYFAYNNWDLERLLKIKMEYNKTRPNRHGGKLY